MPEYTSKLNLYKPNRADSEITVDTSLSANFQKIDDGFDEVTQQLAQKANVIEVARKVDQSYVDAQLASIVSGAPKGTYSTLADLRVAYPSGTDGIFLVLADGHWYYWHEISSDWLDGGLYQAQEVADNSITPEKTNFFRSVSTKNKFTSEWIGGRIIGTTGAEDNHVDFSKTKDFIEVRDGINYTVTLQGITPGIIPYIYYFNSDKNIISYISKDGVNSEGNAVFTFMAPPQTKYARFGLFRNQITNSNLIPTKSQLEFGLVSTDHIEPFVYILDEEVEVNVSNIVQYENDYVKAIAHRGYSETAPENTEPAYISAKKHGFKYVEADIRITSDGVPVLAHLDNISSFSNGSGLISQSTLSYLKTLDFGGWKSPEYAGTKILTLEEFLRLCKKLNLHPYLDCKADLSEEKAQEIVTMIKKLGMLRKITWLIGGQSFFNLRALDPMARCGITSATPLTDYDFYATLITQEGNLFFDYDYTIVTKEIADMCAEKGIGLEVFTVNDPEVVLQLAELNVTGITTDKLNIGKILNDYYS